jgi:hypothetical protein
MDANKIIEIKDKRHKCISCAYLCTKGDEYIGIARRNYALKETPESLANPNTSFRNLYYNTLSCYKNVLPNFYGTAISDIDIHKKITTENCPANKWRAFINGQTPAQAEIQETGIQSIRWAKWAFIAIIISIALSIILFVVSRISK